MNAILKVDGTVSSFVFCFKIYPPDTLLIHDDWSTNGKIRTSVNLNPEQWRSSKDYSIHNFLIHFIVGKDDKGGLIFEEHVVHFLCDSNSTETVGSCINLEKLVEYVMEKSPKTRVILRWTDGTSKQYKNVGTVGFEKYIAVKYQVFFIHSFFPTNWGKGKIDLLGGIVHRLYSKLIPILLEKSQYLKVVVKEMNSRYSVPGSTSSESSLSTRVFFYVSLTTNKDAKSSRTTWKTLSFPLWVGFIIETTKDWIIFFVFEICYQYCLMVTPDKTDGYGYCRHRTCRTCRRYCMKLKFPDCVNERCGKWESSPIKYVRGPQILFTDSQVLKRRVGTTPTRKVYNNVSSLLI